MGRLRLGGPLLSPDGHYAIARIQTTAPGMLSPVRKNTEAIISQKPTTQPQLHVSIAQPWDTGQTQPRETEPKIHHGAAHLMAHRFIARWVALALPNRVLFLDVRNFTNALQQMEPS
jgi:hypothetical protein